MYQTDLTGINNFLLRLAGKVITQDAMNWVLQKQELLKTSEAEKDLYLNFSAAPRFSGKKQLEVSAEDLEEANRLRKGFNPSRWTADQAVRTLLLLSFPYGNKEKYLDTLNKFFSTADMGELVALYASLPLWPYPEAWKARAAEGIRTNIGIVFDAVAFENPYPADYLEEAAWNQMVLKTLFVGKSLFRIYGLDARSNPALARMLSDYAHERWAAGRTVSPELWRSVGPHLDQHLISDIKKLFSQPDPIQHEAAALACAQSNLPEARILLEQHPELKQQIEAATLTWDQVGNKAIAV